MYDKSECVIVYGGGVPGSILVGKSFGCAGIDIACNNIPMLADKGVILSTKLSESGILKMFLF